MGIGTLTHTSRKGYGGLFTGDTYVQTLRTPQNTSWDNYTMNARFQIIKSAETYSCLFGCTSLDLTLYFHAGIYKTGDVYLFRLYHGADGSGSTFAECPIHLEEDRIYNVSCYHNPSTETSKYQLTNEQGVEKIGRAHV